MVLFFSFLCVCLIQTKKNMSNLYSEILYKPTAPDHPDQHPSLRHGHDNNNNNGVLTEEEAKELQEAYDKEKVKFEKRMEIKRGIMHQLPDWTPEDVTCTSMWCGNKQRMARLQHFSSVSVIGVMWYTVGTFAFSSVTGVCAIMNAIQSLVFFDRFSNYKGFPNVDDSASTAITFSEARYLSVTGTVSLILTVVDLCIQLFMVLCVVLDANRVMRLVRHWITNRHNTPVPSIELDTHYIEHTPNIQHDHVSGYMTSKATPESNLMYSTPMFDNIFDKHNKD